MLHKSQSSKLRSWKYAIILPVLGLFLMSFNTKEVFIEIDKPSVNLKALIHTKTEASLSEFYTAITDKTEMTFANENKQNESRIKIKEKSTPAKIKRIVKKVNETSVTIINKYTSDLELDIIKNDLKIKGLSVKFKKVKRNNSGEIISIKIDVSSDDSNANYNVNSDEAIAPIKIVFDQENKTISIGNSEAEQTHTTYVYGTESNYHKIHKSDNGSHVYVGTDYDNDNHEGEDIIISTNINNDKTKVINGHNRRVHVSSSYSGDKTVELLIDEGTSDNENETIIIKGKAKNSYEISDDNHEDVLIQKNANRIYISGNGDKNPLYIIDGKEVSKSALKELNPDEIESIEVIKGKKATKTYGNKGKDGVIVIKTKGKG